MILNIKKLI
ncbi:hypothetical protein BpHYR1_031367 [Brachionus plicatilis]|uniref:Uncharacterized protein n=1 Tax=Brachionus plicatilis TaxID=10195 RepID=A0A3M7SZE2_BRAPC|nr:hypothetical protein BpHYR1_031367 [Brachionus plicatilis]